MSDSHSSSVAASEGIAQNESEPSPSPSPEDWTDPNASFGPSVFARTRALWVTGTKTGTPCADPRLNDIPSEAQKKLEDALGKFEATDEALWKGYLAEVHRRLVGGDKLKKGLKLPLAVRFMSYHSLTLADYNTYPGTNTEDRLDERRHLVR